MIDQVTTVIRSVGERTESICRELLEEVIPTKHIHTINVKPFSEAIKKSFQIGLKHDLPWTLCIDADVLIDKIGILQLLDKAGQLDENVLEVQGLVLDKFFGVKRPAGNHLYRTQLIPKALGLIPEEGKSLRPESDMLNAMSAQGFPWVQRDVAVGIHDFEQFYSDIYRKCFLHAHKHRWIVPEIEMFWKEMSANDKDYQVALWGLRSGKIYNGAVLVDKSFLQHESSDVLNIKGISEKSEARTTYTADMIREKIRFYESLNSYKTLQNSIFPSTLWNRVVLSQDGKGPSTIMWCSKVLSWIGHKIEMLGKKIQHFSRFGKD